MELAAVVVVPTKEHLPAEIGARGAAFRRPLDAQAFYSSGMPILGNDLLTSWMEPIRKIGVASMWLGSGLGEDSEGPDLSHFANQGIERLLVIRLKSYAEMDLIDLLRFHRECRNSITHAQDAQGHLGVSLLDRTALHTPGHHFAGTEGDSAPVCGRTPYEFRGYAKRVLSAKERQELVRDALLGACAMRPSGTQIRDQVWIGEGAGIAETARIIGPAYIGARTIVREGATIGPFSSLENDCVVDCGTTVEESTLLPRTYLAPGLMVRRAQVDGGLLEDLRSGVIADLTPAALGSRVPQSRQDRKSSTAEARRGSAHASAGAPASFSASDPWIQVQL